MILRILAFIFYIINGFGFSMWFSQIIPGGEKQITVNWIITIGVSMITSMGAVIVVLATYIKTQHRSEAKSREEFVKNITDMHNAHILDQKEHSKDYKEVVSNNTKALLELAGTSRDLADTSKNSTEAFFKIRESLIEILDWSKRKPR